jgi:serine/threonine protein kinase/tetratricopeptide (TPR) repeat protein
MQRARAPDRWRRIETAFNHALDLPPAERSEYLARECGSDSELLAEVESLLRAASADSPLIGDSVATAACDFVAGDTLSPGQRISYYSVVAPIGSGGMGRVYLAEDTRLGRRVALKTLAPGLANAEHQARFEQEARAASALNHPNILTVYEIGQDGGVRFIVSEYVEGTTLREVLDRGEPIAPERALGIAKQIASGLEAAHAKGITHRDIKPENVIIRPDGIVKVVDFGIARLAPGTGEIPAAHTRSGVIIGTGRYMSPEQARGERVDQRTDIFSAGVVLYEMLAGRPPFDGQTVSDVVAAILKTDPPPLARGRVPAPLQRVVSKALSKNRDDRYANGGEFRAALESSGWRRDLLPRSVWLLLSAAILAAGLLLAWRLYVVRTVMAKPTSVAILPFQNLRPDPATDFLGFSLADEVITKLSYVGSLSVRPSSAVAKYRSGVADPRAVGRELNVNSLLAGSYLRDGDTLHINAQLIDVASDKVVWHDSMDVRYENLLAVQNRVAEEMISGLEIRLTDAEQRNVGASSVIGQRAYEDYLRGIDLYAAGDYAGSIRVLEAAARMQPDYARIWAHLGRAYTTGASLEFGGREYYAKARAAYGRALQLDPSLVTARVYMANLLTDTGLVEQAVPVLRKALEASPNNAEAHWELGYAYRFAGALDESLQEALKAREIDPTVKLTSSALNTWLYLGKYDEFLASLPNLDRAYILFYRGLAQFYLYHRDLALNDFNRSYDLAPASLQGQLGKAFAYAILRQPDNGTNLLQHTQARVLATGVTDAEGLYKIAQAYAVLGARREAVMMMKGAVAGGFFCYPYFKSDPLLENIRGEPEFAVVLERARQRHERFRATFLQAP